MPMAAAPSSSGPSSLCALPYWESWWSHVSDIASIASKECETLLPLPLCIYYTNYVHTYTYLPIHVKQLRHQFLPTML